MTPDQNKTTARTDEASDEKTNLSHGPASPARTRQPILPAAKAPITVAASEVDDAFMVVESSIEIDGGRSVRYHPVRLHAKGGLGEVYLADDLELRRQVALKEIQVAFAFEPESRRRFIAEARITGYLEHPGIVPVYGLGAHADGRPYYAMRFIHGRTLGAAIQEFHAVKLIDFSSLEFRGLLRRFVDVCNAVGYAHDRGIIHQDLKPANIMLGSYGETLVVDWGLAKHLKESKPNEYGAGATTPRELAHDPTVGIPSAPMVGTPPYMSPEQAGGVACAVGRASDVYSLGAVLYSLLSGRAPFAGAMQQVLLQVQTGDFPSPCRHVPRLPRSLEAICLKAMALCPEDRYAGALALAADVERWLAGEAVQAFPEPWHERVWRWTRKHRLVMALAGVSLVITLIATAISNVFIGAERDRANDERGRANRANEIAQANAAATRQVVDKFLIEIGDDGLSEIPRMEQVRKNLVELAVEHFRALLEQHPEDVALRIDAATVLRRSANLHRMMNELPDAQKRYEAAVTLLAGIPHPKLTFEAQIALLGLLSDQADLVQRLHGPRAADPAYQKAHQTAQQLIISSDLHRTLQVQFFQALAQLNLGENARQRGQYATAIPLLDAACNTLEALVAENPAVSNFNFLLISALNNRVKIASAEGQREQAQTLSNRALQVARAAQRLNDKEPNIRFLLAWTLMESGALQRSRAGQENQAGTGMDQASTLLEQLVKEQPKTASFRRKWAEALTAQGELALGQGRFDLAAEYARRALNLLEALDRASSGATLYHEYLAAAHRLACQTALRRGDRVAAKTHADQARQRLVQARAGNPESPALAAEAKVIEALLENPSP